MTSGTATITNCTIAANSTGSSTQQTLLVRNAALKIRNTLILGTGPATEVKNLQGPDPEIFSSLIGSTTYDETGTTYTASGDTSPVEIFEQFNGTVNIDNDYHLKEDSFAVNRGSNVFLQTGQVPDLSGLTTDIEGNARIQGATVDLGAFESTVSSAIPDWQLYR